jgi:hypothetical protein
VSTVTGARTSPSFFVQLPAIWQLVTTKENANCYLDVESDMGVLRGGTDSEGVPLKRADLGAIDLQI